MNKVKLLFFLLFLVVISPEYVFCQDSVGFMQRKHNLALGNMNKDRRTNINVGIMTDVDTLRGVQFSLTSSIVRKKASGLNSAVIRAVCFGNIKGVQSSFISNVAAAQMKGLQFAGVVNIGGEVKGMQLSAFNNIAGMDMHGLQLAGIENISLSVDRGLQLAGVMNICINDMKGMQLSAFNYADNMTGLQLGLINVCTQNPRGAQIGLFNYSRENNVRKIGLVNLSPQSRIQMMIFYGNASKFNVAARFRNNNTYNIIGFGTHYLGLDKDFSGSLFYRMGYWANVFNDRWTLNADIGFSHIETFTENNLITPERLYSLNTNISLEYQCLKRLGFFVGTGYGIDRYYEHNANYRKSFLIKAGIILF